MSARLRRFVFWILLALGLFGYRIGRAQEPIAVSVQPRVALVNPYKRTTFWFRWQIEPHPDNRRYALMYTCGSELHSSQGEVNGDKHPRTTDRWVELTVLQDCEFMACVIRTVEKEVKTLCDWFTVTTAGRER